MKLTFDPLYEEWSLAFRGSFYVWKGDPFDREAAEALAREIIRMVLSRRI